MRLEMNYSVAEQRYIELVIPARPESFFAYGRSPGKLG